MQWFLSATISCKYIKAIYQNAMILCKRNGAARSSPRSFLEQGVCLFYNWLKRDVSKQPAFHNGSLLFTLLRTHTTNNLSPSFGTEGLNISVSKSFDERCISEMIYSISFGIEGLT